MTINTEALRAKFEKYINPAGDMKIHRVSDGGYAGHGMNQSWHDFQAGHAAGVAAERKRCATMHESIEAAVKAVDMGFMPNEILDENSPIMQAFRYAIRAGDGEAAMEQGYYGKIETPREALYEAAAAMDNQDVPIEDWPVKLIAALARAGFAVVPVELPHDVLGRAAIAGVAETGNPKHAWDFLIAATRAA